MRKISLTLILFLISFAGFSQKGLERSIDLNGLKLKSGDTLSISTLKNEASAKMILPDIKNGNWKLKIISATGETKVANDLGVNQISLDKYYDSFRKFSRIEFSRNGEVFILHLNE